MQTAATPTTDIAMLRADEVRVGDVLHFDREPSLRVETVGRRDCHGLLSVAGEGRSVTLRADRRIEVERAVDAAGNLVGYEPEQEQPLPDDEPDRDYIERGIAERHARQGRV